MAQKIVKVTISEDEIKEAIAYWCNAKGFTNNSTMKNVTIKAGNGSGGVHYIAIVIDCTPVEFLGAES